MNIVSRSLTPAIAAAGLALSLGAVASPALASSAGSASPAASDSPAHSARLIDYANGHRVGVTVHTKAQAKRLKGSPASFQRFVGRTAQHVTDTSTCEAAAKGVTVEKVRTDGYAVGGVNDCGGYAALWAEVHGHWKQIDGTQDSWECRTLHRYTVPSSIAGHSCYNYKTNKAHHYHQR